MFVASSQTSFESGPSITQTSEKEEKIFCLLFPLSTVLFGSDYTLISVFYIGIEDFTGKMRKI